jgi:hypothetical protein
MTQEPSILPDLSNRATQEYSDLFAVSGSSFLTPIDQITINNSSNTTIETSSPPHPNRYDTSSLIDLKTPKRTSPTTDQPKTARSSPAKKYPDLMDHSISSYDLLPKALSPSTPVSLVSSYLPPHLSVSLDSNSFWSFPSHLERTSISSSVPKSLLVSVGLLLPHRKTQTKSYHLNSLTTSHQAHLFQPDLKARRPAVVVTSLELIQSTCSGSTNKITITHHDPRSHALNPPQPSTTGKRQIRLNYHPCHPTNRNHTNLKLRNLYSNDPTVHPKALELVSSALGFSLVQLGTTRAMGMKSAGWMSTGTVVDEKSFTSFRRTSRR